MDDKKLLTLAAKAANYSVKWTLHLAEEAMPPPWYCFVLDGQEWDPLADDGDALRLAVGLQIAINPWAGKSVCGADGGPYATEDWDDQGEGASAAATRRAIVRAAAAIGEGVK